MSPQHRSIEQRLEQLEDREKIKELKYRYAFHLDNGYDPDSIAALFSEDGEWIIKGVGVMSAVKVQSENTVKI